MAVIQPRGGELDRKQLLKARRLIHFRYWKEIPIAQAWPRRRGKTKSVRQQAWIDRFTMLAKLTPQMPALERDNAELLMEGPAVYWRDVIHTALSGKLIMEKGVFRITTPTANVYRTTTEALTAGVEKVLTPNTKIWDNYTWWNATLNPSRLTAKEGGLYLVIAQTWWPNSTGGDKSIALRQNGNWTGWYIDQRLGAANSTGLAMQAVVYMSPGDYITLSAQSSVAGAVAQIIFFAILAITPEGVF